jgi:hypothetical protein
VLKVDRRRAAIRRAIFSDIEFERDHQEMLRESGKFSHTCATPGMSDNTSFRVLFEEVDEALYLVETAGRLRYAMGLVARVLNDRLGNDEIAKIGVATRELRAELIQVAAVATAWIERLDGYDDTEIE